MRYPRRGRRLVNLQKPLPRFVRTKLLACGATGFFWEMPTYHRRKGCPIPSEPLGTDYATACGESGSGGRAATLNALFNEWKAKKNGEPIAGLVRFGTVDWLFREYKQTNAYLEKVSERSRPDYERTMLLVTDLVTKKGDRIGDRGIKAITPISAERMYGLITNGPNGSRPRQGEKVVGLCARAWKVVRRFHPDLFDKAVPNPWIGVTKKRRTKAVKPAASREEVYKFAWGCIEAGNPEAAAAAVICFEWLQRPENVLAGYLRWTDYRSEEWPNAIRIEHHKTGARVLHPLEETIGGMTTKFYEDAEAVLAQLPRRGIPMILREIAVPRDQREQKTIHKPFSFSGFQKIVQRLRAQIGLPPTFTLDACRHGGMTELEEAELTDGQGRALSAHKSRAYEGYAKRTMQRALAATRKPHAHRLANETETKFRNEHQNALRNGNK
jgi:hypothetical protein